MNLKIAYLEKMRIKIIFSKFTRLKLIRRSLNKMFMYTIWKSHVSPFQKTMNFKNSLKNIWVINNFVWKKKILLGSTQQNSEPTLSLAGCILTVAPCNLFYFIIYETCEKPPIFFFALLLLFPSNLITVFNPR